jgi:DNA-binding transcriptional LysR family regulator
LSAFSLPPQPPLRPRRRSNSASFTEWHIDLRLLRAFLAVAEEGQIGRAAHRLSMAASPLSRQIARLEDTIGVRLFERYGGGVRMTGPGKVLFREAQELLYYSRAVAERTRAADGSGRANDVRL